MRLPIEAGKAYEPLWLTKKRYVITMGGRGAGRSFETSQKIVANFVQTKRRFRAAIMRAIHADNYLMSAARYFLSEMVKANADPEAEARQRERAARDV